MKAAVQLERGTRAEINPENPFVRDVRAGLGGSGQRWIPCKYFYDAVGSALFEVIGVLPEYGLTRADERILRRYASEIAAAISPPPVVAELGSGSGRKTRLILEALARRQPTIYHPIEISAAALALAERELNHLDGVSVRGFEAEYLDGLARAAAKRSQNQRLLVLFLGSSIGNFNRNEDCEFLMRIRALLRAGDALLLGTDLVKPVSQMLPAYDDPAGVTAAFNLNLLGRINRELGGNFDVSAFTHRAIYNRERHRIEMHLISRKPQVVRLLGTSLSFRHGESIHTESSYKYSIERFAALARGAGWKVQTSWTDAAGMFSVHALVAE